jgi:hypothetical protein
MRLDGSTTLPVSVPATNWSFPEGYTGYTFQEYLTILNTNRTPAAVTILLAPQAASSAGARMLHLTVGALSRATADIRALNAGNSVKSVGMIINSDQPIVAERVEYFGDGAGSGKFGSTVSRGISVATTQLRIAYGASGGAVPDAQGRLQAVGNQQYITLLNPNTTGAPIQVTATFNDSTGRPAGQPVTVNVAPGTRQTIATNPALGVSAINPFSVMLSATGPIEAEAAQYYGGSPNSGFHPGAAFPALPNGAADSFLSDLSTLLPDGVFVKRTVFLYNPGATPIQVAATYYSGSGASAHANYSVPASGITTVNVNQDIQPSLTPGPIGAEFTVTGGAGRVIVYAVGQTVDNLSVTEDVGVPAT